MPQSRLNLRCFCACWLIVCGGLNAVAEDKIAVSSVGLNGYFAVGRTTRLMADVTPEADGEYQVQVGAPDPHGNRVHFRSEPVTLSAGQTTPVGVSFQAGQLGATLDVQLLSGDKVVASTKLRLTKNAGLLSPGVRIIGAIGKPAGLDHWFNARQIVIAHSDSTDAPDSVTRSKSEASKLAAAAMSEAAEPGADFGDIATKYSDVAMPTLFSRNKQNAALVDAIRDVKIGDVGGPFETDMGFHIVLRDILPDQAITEQLNNRLVLNLDPGQLSTDPRVLSAMQTLVIAGDYDLGDEQVECLSQWIHYGGHLIVAVAGDVETYLETPLGKQVQNWVPIESQTSKLIELPGVEGFVDNSASIPMERQRVIAARIGETTGDTLATGSDGPLIEQVAVGFGRVTLVGLDIASGPLSKWAALPVMMNRLAFDEKRARKESGASSSAIGHTGVTDLATQLHSSQADFPEIKRPTSWIAMLLILAYLIAIGPLDYFIVHRLLKKPRLTWFTFPCLVACGCAAGIFLAKSVNGNELRLNQTAIVDIDAGSSNSCRLHSWFTVYSPDSRRAEVRTAPSADLSKAVGAERFDPSLLMWNGIPENVFGGMLRASGASLGNIQYDVQPNTVTGLPIETWSTSSLHSHWRADAKPEIQSNLSTTSVGLLKGSLTHNLPFPIKNWIVAHGLRVYQPRNPGTEVPTIRPKQTWSPQAPTVRGRDLEGYLTGLQTIQVKVRLGEGGSNIRQKKTVYDSLELDPGYAIRMLSLHEAAGGKSYTGLTNTVLSELDFSRLIHLNRAVLIGEIDMPAGSFMMDGTEVTPTRSRTFVRIVLPVESGQ